MDFVLNLNKYLSSDFIDKLLVSLEKERTNSLLLNIQKMSIETFKKLFPNVKEHQFIKNLFYYDKNEYDFGKNYLQIAGVYYIIDASSALVSYFLNINDGDLVLDLCAAPGGKTISLLLNNPDKNFEVISNDLSYPRALELSKNIERIGKSNVIVTNNDFSKIYKNYLNTFDKIILDAPCSGSAMFRKNDLAYKDRSIEKVLKLKKEQLNILDYALKTLKNDGYLVYSTCSFSYEEDEEVILETLKSNDAIEIIDIPYQNGFYKSEGLKEAIHLFPCLYEGEGQFIALLHKKDDSINQNSKSKEKKSKFTALKNEFHLDFKYELIKNNSLYFYNNPLNLDYLNIIRCGLEAFIVKGNLFVPSFQLAHYLANYPTIELNEEETKLYLHGDEIKKELALNNSYYLVSHDSINLGFVKYSNGRLKNLYPKGLRH